MVPTPDMPSAITPTSLNGVSCPRPNVCFAVGSTGAEARPDAPIELWNGTSWSHQPSPDVGHGALDAVSCSGLRACTAVGVTVRPGGLNSNACRALGRGALARSIDPGRRGFGLQRLVRRFLSPEAHLHCCR